MHLLACSYENIGPFFDQTLLVRFLSGSHLIQAPIGSGKSFLFFDGPLFGLYKHRSRPMLNKKAKKGTVEILFEHEGSHWCIQRMLSPTTKGGESVKTALREVKGNIEAVMGTEDTTEVLEKSSLHITKLLGKHALAQIEFTNSKETDSAIQDLLPPKEVLMNTNILMQESSNVFELAPAERVQVFKHLFGLLGIDEAKDRINERRKELQTTIQIKGDTTSLTQKLQIAFSGVKRMYESIHTLYSTSTKSDSAGLWNATCKTGFYEDLGLLNDSLQIQDFRFSEDDRGRAQAVKEGAQAELHTITLNQGREQEQKKTKEAKEIESKATQLKIAQIHKELQLLTQQFTSAGGDISKQLEEQKKTLLTQKQTIEASIPRDLFATYSTPIDPETSLSIIIQELLHTGSNLGQQIKSVESTLTHNQSGTKEASDSLDLLSKQKKDLQLSHEKQGKFTCDKIEGSCPYVNLINKNAVSALTTQIHNIDAQILTATAKQKKLQEKEKEIVTEHGLLTKQVKELKAFLTAIERKKLQESAITLENLVKEQNQIDAQLAQQQAKRTAQQTLEKKKITLEAQEKQLSEYSKTILAELQEMSTKTTSDEDLEGTARNLKNIVQQLDQFIQENKNLEELATEAKKHQKEVKILQEKLVVTKDLYQVFSKELMIVVLQDFLPALQEVLNAYLSQIVTYEVRFLTPNDEGNELELDIQIIDEKGVRNVKSLSGGQKTVLKLVRMLGVASLFKSSFVLLDETINNLDSETISQVADVLEEFVLGQQRSFYVVTHSPQIQQMNIRNSIIHVK